jgi:hypothetical protein
MNYQEILAVLKEETSVEEFAYGWKFPESLGKCVDIDAYGGEGQGETWYRVKHFVDHDVYIKVDGFYTSYDGTDFEDWDEACSEVRPTEKNNYCV